MKWLKLKKHLETYGLANYLLKRDGHIKGKQSRCTTEWLDLDSEGRPLFHIWYNKFKKEGGGRVDLTYMYVGRLKGPDGDWLKIAEWETPEEG